MTPLGPVTGVAVVGLVPLVLRLGDRKSGQSTKAGSDWGGAEDPLSLCLSAFPLISLSNELERQLGTRSLPRDPGSLEPERRGHQGLEGGPGPPLEQDTGLRSQAQPGPVG